MKKIVTILFLLVTSNALLAQEVDMKQFLEQLKNAKDEKTRVDLLTKNDFDSSVPDSSFVFALRGIKLAQSIGYLRGEINGQMKLGDTYWAVGDFESSIKIFDNVMRYAIANRDTQLIIRTKKHLVDSYRDFGKYEKAIRLADELSINFEEDKLPIYYAFKADVYNRMGNMDSAYYYIGKASSITRENTSGWVYLITGQVMEKHNQDSIALVNYKKSISKLLSSNNYKDLVSTYTGMAKLFHKKSLSDSAMYYANKALRLAQAQTFNRELIDALLTNSKIYEKYNPELALNYFKQAIEARDNREKQRRITADKFNKEIRNQEINTTELEYKSRNQSLPQTTIDVGKEKPVIESLNNQYSKYLLEGDSVSIATMYASNAMMGGKKGPEILSAVGHWIRNAIKNDTRHVSFKTVTLNTDDDLLIETGKAEGRNEQGELKYTFRYLVVWKKEDGTWKLYRDVPL